MGPPSWSRRGFWFREVSGLGSRRNTKLGELRYFRLLLSDSAGSGTSLLWLGVGGVSPSGSWLRKPNSRCKKEFHLCLPPRFQYPTERSCVPLDSCFPRETQGQAVLILTSPKSYQAQPQPTEIWPQFCPQRALPCSCPSPLPPRGRKPWVGSPAAEDPKQPAQPNSRQPAQPQIPKASGPNCLSPAPAAL